VGDSFGTRDPVVFETDSVAEARGRTVLGRDALLLAYLLFTVAAGVVGLAIYSVVTSGLPPMEASE
jgi:hypothetical protein